MEQGNAVNIGRRPEWKFQKRSIIHFNPEGLINMGQVGGRPGLTQSLLVFGDLILTAEGRNEGK